MAAQHITMHLKINLYYNVGISICMYVNSELIVFPLTFYQNKSTLQELPVSVVIFQILLLTPLSLAALCLPIFLFPAGKRRNKLPPTLTFYLGCKVF